MLSVTREVTQVSELDSFLLNIYTSEVELELMSSFSKCTANNVRLSSPSTAKKKC